MMLKWFKSLFEEDDHAEKSERTLECILKENPTLVKYLDIYDERSVYNYDPNNVKSPIIEFVSYLKKNYNEFLLDGFHKTPKTLYEDHRILGILHDIKNDIKYNFSISKGVEVAYMCSLIDLSNTTRYKNLVIENSWVNWEEGSLYLEDTQLCLSKDESRYLVSELYPLLEKYFERKERYVNIKNIREQRNIRRKLTKIYKEVNGE